VPQAPHLRLDRVLAQLRLYEHPLLNFTARAKGEGVEIIIRFKDESVPVHTYYFDLHPRDLDDSQFEWSFQRQLYDALHDYFVEMFIRTPQDRADCHRKGPVAAADSQETDHVGTAAPGCPAAQGYRAAMRQSSVLYNSKRKLINL